MPKCGVQTKNHNVNRSLIMIEKINNLFDAVPALVPSFLETNLMSSSLFNDIDKIFESSKLRQLTVYPTDVYYVYKNDIPQECIIDIALAGMNKENCEVKVNNNKLIVEVGKMQIQDKPIIEQPKEESKSVFKKKNKSNVKAEVEAAEENIRKEYLVNQIAQRHAIMNWTLGNNIDKKRISVEFENGILKIILPFRPKEEIETIIDIK
jgi:HSP20 family molecular chaperone IbpA